VKDTTFVHGMFYAFIFQDALRFRISGEDVMVDLVEAIENYRWCEFEAWLDAHHDLLIQHHKTEASDSSSRSAPSLLQRETPLGGRNDGDEATSSASSPKLGIHGKK